MVNMIGFHHREPTFNTAGFGEPGWFLNMRLAPTSEFLFRAMLTTPCAHALFRSPEEASAFTGHPGDVKHMAKHYIEYWKGN